MQVLLALGAGLLALSAAFAVCGTSEQALPPAIDLPCLLAELQDLYGLAQWPDPPFSTTTISGPNSLASSPDGESDRRFIVCDVRGPGVLVRLWSPQPSAAGRVAVEIDGDEVLSAPLAELMSGAWQPSGSPAPPVPPPLAEFRGGCGVWQLPLPFARRLRLLAERRDWVFRADCRSYPAGTPVVSFNLPRLQTVQEQVRKLAREVSWLMPSAPPDVTRRRRLFSGEVAAGECVRLLDHRGAGAIEHLQVEVPRVSAALQTLVLSVRCDGAERPQVLCPLLDFFGGGLAAQPRSGLATTWRSDAVGISRWVMPFARSAEIEVHNVGKEKTGLRGEVVVADVPWTQRHMHFHARWQQVWPVPARPAQDLTLFASQGQGVWVGQQWQVLNPSHSWWGDGREELLLDANPPRRHDCPANWFGLAADPGARWDSPWHACWREAEQGFLGWTRLQRLLTLERIPWHQRLNWTVRLQPWEPRGELGIWSTTFWYARPGGRDCFPAVPVSALRFPPAVTGERKP